MFDALVEDLSQRYGLGDRGRDLFGLLVAYVHNDRRGGFTGFIEGFREQGHGELVSSWLGNPDAGGLNASDVGMVFGQGLLNDWGSRLGVSRATVAAAISGVLPRLVAELTPGGRIPGGFATVAPLGAEATAAPRREFGNAPQLREDPVAAPEPAAPARFTAPAETDTRERMHPQPVAGVDGHRAHTGHVRFEPAFEDIPAAPQPKQRPVTSLRREPAPEAAAPRAPVQSRPALDPAEQRLADMTAAFDRPARADSPGSGLRADARPDNWRAAVHPPRRKRGFGWLLWLIVLLAVLAGAAWFAWSQGLLAPYIDQLQLPIQSSPSTV